MSENKSSLDYYEQKKSEFEFFSDTVLSNKPNLHPELEMVIVVEGSVDAYVNNCKFTVQKNDAVLVFPNQLHCYEQTADAKCLLIIFNAAVVPYANKTLLQSDPVSNIINLSSMKNSQYAISRLKRYGNYCLEAENEDPDC